MLPAAQPGAGVAGNDLAPNIIELKVTLEKDANDEYLAEGVIQTSLSDFGDRDAMRFGYRPPLVLGDLPFAELFRADRDPPDTDPPFARGIIALGRDLPLPVGQAPFLDAVGRGLYNALPLTVRDLYNRAWGYVAMHQTDRPRPVLRLRLFFRESAAELARLPWELMKPDRLFFLQHAARTLIRTPANMQVMPAYSLPAQGQPIRMLIWVSTPLTLPAADFQAEVEQIRKSLPSTVQIDPFPPADLHGDDATLLNALRKTLLEGNYHILHYIGHGDVDAEGQGILAIDNPAAPTGFTPVAGDTLIDTVASAASLQLIFLNACRTAQVATRNVFSALVYNLASVRPAAVGMQYSLPQQVAAGMASEFYAKHLTGSAMDVSLNEARFAIKLAPGPGLQNWAIPVLCSASAVL